MSTPSLFSGSEAKVPRPTDPRNFVKENRVYIRIIRSSERLKEVHSMCDYSLYEFPNRLAREGEELVTYRFPLGSLGLASPRDVENTQGKSSGKRLWGTVRSLSAGSSYWSKVCAICVPPGSRVILKDIPAQMQKDLGLCPEEGGKFIETSVDVFRHRDAIQLANGIVIPLQHLHEGQRVEVLSLVPAGEFVE